MAGGLGDSPAPAAAPQGSTRETATARSAPGSAPEPATDTPGSTPDTATATATPGSTTATDTGRPTATGTGTADREPTSDTEPAGPEAEPAEAAAPGRSPADAAGRRWARWKDRAAWPPAPPLAVLGLTAMLAVPLLVALAGLRHPRWYPMFDMAQYEMLVRDVPTTHPPLLGLTGRIYGYGVTGSHPGPLGFYLLWPVYALLGSDGWSLQAATGALVVAAAGLAVWLGFRRGGWPFALAVTVMLALLLRAYGATVLLQTWNPHLPLVWWVTFLLAVWSVLCRDLRALPVAVVAGSLCMQTHISYIPLVGGLGALLAGVLAVRAWRTWQARRAPQAGRAEPAAGWRPLLTWVGGSAALLAVLWVPPLVDQLTNTPGNLSVIRHNFTNPPEERIALDGAVAIWAEHLDLPAIAAADVIPGFPYVGIPVNQVGLLVLAVWAVSAALAWRGGDPALRRLHLVVGAATALGLVATTRILGPPWPYLTYWGWGTTAVMALATAWTFLSIGSAGSTGAPAAPDEGRVPALRWPQPTRVVLGVTALLLVAQFSVEATSAEMSEADVSEALGDVARATVDRLEEDPAGCGDGCRVLVGWSGDPLPIAPGFGMVAALEREGYDARTLSGMKDWLGDHRITRPSDADLEVHVVVSEEAADEWRDRPGAELVASAQPDDPLRPPVAAFIVVRGHDADD